MSATVQRSFKPYNTTVNLLTQPLSLTKFCLGALEFECFNCYGTKFEPLEELNSWKTCTHDLTTNLTPALVECSLSSSCSNKTWSQEF